MSLISYSFIFVLFVSLLIYYFVFREQNRWILLLLVSIAFYMSFGLRTIVFPLVTAVITWVSALRMEQTEEKGKAYRTEHALSGEEKKQQIALVKKQKKKILAPSLWVIFGILAVFKYTDPALGLLSRVINLLGTEGSFEPVNLLLPLGISYYSFQSAGYLIDVFRKKYKAEKSFPKLLLFLLFFPQLISGPINRYDKMKDQLFAGQDFQRDRFYYGFVRMLYGLFKKLVIADRMAGPVMALLGAETSGAATFLSIIGYALWMYADFSGGIDMVLGISGLFGIRMSENFRQPFFSGSLAEFWTRWHMSLMEWMKEYVFFPAALSGLVKKTSEKGKKVFGHRVAERIPVYLSSILVWFVTGAWHGASWKFITWGMVNCFVILLSQELDPLFRSFREKSRFAATSVYRAFRILRTFLIFSVIEMFEEYRFPEVFHRLSTLFVPFGGVSADLPGLTGPEMILLPAAWLFIFILESRAQKRSLEDRMAASLSLRCLSVIVLLFAVLIFGVYGHGYEASAFFYNQF